ncbi:hypothetical protein [Nocardia sp. NPDC059228]|uniref:hypothetical protein n=1 Tax=Nocardia sp. NPDC059228 TaxID=3346777 RepID=UPI003690F7FA
MQGAIAALQERDVVAASGKGTAKGLGRAGQMDIAGTFVGTATELHPDTVMHREAEFLA